MAQPGRELVQQADAAAPSARRLLQRRGIGSGHQGLPQEPQRGPEAVRVEHDGRHHPGQGQ